MWFTRRRDAITTADFDLNVGRMLLGAFPLVLLGIRLARPDGLELNIINHISAITIGSYCWIVLGFSFFSSWAKRNIYPLVIISIALIGFDYLYNLHSTQFSTSARAGIMLMMAVTLWYFNDRLHVLIFQLVFLLLIVLTAFLSSDQGLIDLETIKFIARFILLSAVIYLIVGSHIHTLQKLMRQSKENIQMMTNLNEGVWQVDNKGIIRFANKMICNMLGYRSEDLVDIINVKDLTASEDKEYLESKLQERRQGISDKYDIRMIRKDGSIIWIQVSAMPIYDKSGAVVGSTSIAVDVTDKKSAEIELDNYSNVLKYTNKELSIKNSELEQFAKMAATDLRFPLEKIEQASLILRHLQDKPDPLADEYMEEITNRSKQMRDLIDALNLYSSSDSDKMQPQIVDLNEVIKEVESNLSDNFKAYNVQLHYSELPKIHADRIQMLRLFKNIIDNSVKYRGEKPPEINISHTLDIDKKQHIFAFEDNGAGIKREDYDKIFMIFQRKNEADNQNIGMGLAISKKIAINHNGRLWFTSNVGKGTTFYLSIPCEEERCPATGRLLSEIEKEANLNTNGSEQQVKAEELPISHEEL